MAYIYQADCWCTKCGEEIKEQITREGHAPDDLDTKRTYGSDDYPEWMDDDTEADSPQHCAAGAECLDAEILSNGIKVGSLLSTNLTNEGVEYIRAMVSEGNNPVHTLWRTRFDWVDFPPEDKETEDGDEE